MKANARMATISAIDELVRIQAAGVLLEGTLQVPSGSTGMVIFAHGSGSSRHSPRNQFVAKILHDTQIGTLLFDLLTPEEEETERFSRHLRFDIGLLSKRLAHSVTWLRRKNRDHLPAGLFGASTGAAAVLVAAYEKAESHWLPSRSISLPTRLDSRHAGCQVAACGLDDFA